MRVSIQLMRKVCMSTELDLEGMDMATAPVHRTTIDIELDAYEHAREALGTRGYRDTVNGALHAVTRAAALGRGAELIRAGGLDLATPEDLTELRKLRPHE